MKAAIILAFDPDCAAQFLRGNDCKTHPDFWGFRLSVTGKRLAALAS